jgi:F-type H+-transporting ATPase subunit a
MMRPLTISLSGFVLAVAIVLAFTIAPALAQHDDAAHDAVHEGEHADSTHGHEAADGHVVAEHGDEHVDDHSGLGTGAHGMDETGHAEEHHAGGAKVPELPNILGVIHGALHGTDAGHAMDDFAAKTGLQDPMGTPFTALETVLSALLVIVLLSVFFIGTRGKLRVAPPAGGRLSRRAMLAEIIVSFFEDFFSGIVGKESVRRHLPFLGTLFIYIFVCNTLGLIFLGKAPTANLSFNAGMAILVFLYVHGGAIAKSPLGYLRHYPGSLPTVKELGGMGYVLIPFMAILFTVIHVLEAFIQPMSLSLRLFGNVLGKDVLLGVFGGLAPYVPLHTPFLFLGLLLGGIQALIFSLLTAVYVTLWEPHDHHADDHGHDHDHGPADIYQHPAHEGVHA